jgi:glycerophosphoryl diester phosphodiesterase
MLVAAAGSMNAGAVDRTATMSADTALPDAPSLFTAFGGDVRALLTCASVTHRSIVVAHRGGFAAGYPENTLETFDRMAAAAPVMFETDIMSSRDGIDFLMHDASVDRTTSGKGPAKDLDWSDIAKLAVTDEVGMETGFHVTRFSDFLATMRGRAFLMLDLKGPSSTQQVVRQVVQSGMLKASIFIAYDFGQAREVRAVAPDALIALGAETQQQISSIETNFAAGKPVVMLTGRLARQPAFYGPLNRAGHFVLAGSYLGSDPADARNELGRPVPEFEDAGANGVQMIVSNDPMRAVGYLRQAGRYVDPHLCVASAGDRRRPD